MDLELLLGRLAVQQVPEDVIELSMSEGDDSFEYPMELADLASTDTLEELLKLMKDTVDEQTTKSGDGEDSVWLALSKRGDSGKPLYKSVLALLCHLMKGCEEDKKRALVGAQIYIRFLQVDYSGVQLH
jgi:hypothetical protein